MPHRSRLGRAPAAAAVLAAVAFGVAGCGAGEDQAGPGTVALQAADGTPGQDGENGAPGQGGSGGDGGGATARPNARPTPRPTPRPSAEDAVANAPAALRACMTRNDGVVDWRTRDDLPQMRTWQTQHRQAAHVRVIEAVYRRFTGSGDNEMTRPSAMGNGFLGYDLDPVNSRLIMLVDPGLIDIGAFRRWVGGVAGRANKAEHVRGTPLRVTVQAGCFSAREVLRVRDWVDGPGAGNIGGFTLNVALDGRFHVTVYPDQVAGAKRMQRKFGPVLALDYEAERNRPAAT